MRALPLAALLLVSGYAAQALPVPMDLLEQYARGEGARAAAVLATVPHDRLEALGKAIQKAAPEWLKTQDEAVVRRRRLAAATLALDLAHAGLLTEWKVLRPIVEWGCELVRKNPAGEAEHTWQLASLALAGGALDKYLLVEPTDHRPIERVYRHLDHAESQFPGDPRWRLARPMALEFSRMSEGVRDDGGSTMAVVAGASGLTEESIERIRARRTATKQVIEGFEQLLNDPVVSSEAYLHLGHQYFVLREFDKALHHYQEAARLGTDPHVRYLGHFLAARVFETRGSRAEAERHYHRALEILPNTQSASTAVAAYRLAGGAPGEAFAVIEAAFSANPRPPDPWRLFFLGDYRLWPSLIQKLREEIK